MGSEGPAASGARWPVSNMCFYHEKKSVASIVAHPDDETLLAGGIK